MSNVESFTAENNACGQTLLHLVARGSAIVAELLRLANNVPPVFKLSNKRDQDRYGDLLADFSYFTSVDHYNDKLEANAVLQDRDEEFRESHIGLLKRFYKVFESVYKFVCDINRYLDDLEEGLYIQQTLETVFMDTTGKQLLCECVYLYGVMLLVIDMKYSGVVRERILVAYHRYSASKAAVDSHMDDVCKLLRSTGIEGSKRPSNYPNNYFSRVPLNKSFVHMAIGRLRSDDVYGQMSNYPLPEHRSIALSTQASMLYVTLYFAPDVLANQQAAMREIVDKHFPDNWIVNIYMGITVNLVYEWDQYRAARAALSNTFANIRNISAEHVKSVPVLCDKALKLLQEGVLVEEYVLDHVPHLMAFLRQCNSTLRWLMLHTAPPPEHKKCKQLHEQVMSNQTELGKIVALLLNTAQLELVLKDMFKQLLDSKQAKWTACQKETQDRLLELADVFSGTKPLARVEKNDNLQAWFREIAKQTSSIDYNDCTGAGRKIAHLIQAIEEVQEFHQLESNWQIRQFLTDTRKYLHQMIRTINVKDEVLIQIQIIGDMSYAWSIIDNYTQFMQNGIKKDPSLVKKLRATFLKLSSALILPLVRISEAGTEDVSSVSQCYSRELVSYVRKVLQIIPQSMFSLLEQVVTVLTHNMSELPTRLDKDKLKEYAQLDERYKVAKLTHAISVFTDGMLMMKSTLVGVIKIDPKKLLEDGIRKELVNQVALAFHNGLMFTRRPGDLCAKLSSLAAKTDGFRRSFEYIQDYLNIYGLRIWQEEVSRIINYNVEQECNAFLRSKVFDWQSLYQSQSIPIPRPGPVDESVTFIGRLAREIVWITNPSTTVYIDAMKAWYDMRSHEEVLSNTIFSKIQDALEPFGLQGLDRLYSFMIVTEIESFVKMSLKLIASDKTTVALLMDLMKLLHPHTQTIDQPAKAYAPVIARFARYTASFSGPILRIGQMQIIRELIGLTLHSSAKFESKQLVVAVETLNSALVSNMQSHYTRGSEAPTDSLYELAPYLGACGTTQPRLQVYYPAKDMPLLPLMCFVHAQSQLTKLQYNAEIGVLVPKPRTQEAIDALPYALGLTTLLRQFRGEYMMELEELINQHIISTVRLPSGPFALFLRLINGNKPNKNILS